jgi:hypothetical protein
MISLSWGDLSVAPTFYNRHSNLIGTVFVKEKDKLLLYGTGLFLYISIFYIKQVVYFLQKGENTL